MKRFVFTAALVACAVTLLSLASAQDVSKRVLPDESKRILPTTHFQMQPAVERTPEQMDVFEATAALPGYREAPFRPTMDASLYAQLKQAAALNPSRSKPMESSPSPLAAVSTKFGGATECDDSGTGFGCWAPPDVAGSIGKSQFVSASNNMFEVRSRAGLLLKSVSLNALMGYSTEALFDPRVQYDEEYQRWIVTADAFAESTTVQYFFVAVSKTSSATGAFWVYSTNTNGFTGTGSFFDFPMVGISQDAILVTANIFGSSSFLGAYEFSLSKARLYNGYGWSVPIFKGLIATLAPAHQLLTDQNGYAWFASAPGNSGAMYMYAQSFPSNPNDTAMFGPYTVSGVATYSFPPAAAQPGSCAPTGAKLDTSDNRFQNVGTQNGDVYYQVHTISDSNSGGFPAPRYYVITGLLSFAPKVAVQNDFWASSTSYDFNPSIAADPAGHFGITWSETDPANGVLASERFTDNNGGNPVSATGINVFTSASCYTGVGTSRWGDYSQTSIDPGTGAVSSTGTKIFWIDNETIPSANFWSTEIAKMTY